jgi:hypothetical protein
VFHCTSLINIDKVYSLHKQAATYSAFRLSAGPDWFQRVLRRMLAQTRKRRTNAERGVLT